MTQNDLLVLPVAALYIGVTIYRIFRDHYDYAHLKSNPEGRHARRSKPESWEPAS